MSYLNAQLAQLAPRDARSKLRLILLVFFFALVIPLAILIQRGYQQFQWEMYFPYRWSAVNIVEMINEDFGGRIGAEQERSYDDYQFYKVAENPILKTKNVLVSPLAKIHEDHHAFPGLLGYFQIDDDGVLSCPTLPFIDRDQIADSGLDLEWGEIEKRMVLQDNLAELLERNSFIYPEGLTPSERSTMAYVKKAINYSDGKYRVEKSWNSGRPMGHHNKDDKPVNYWKSIVEIGQFQMQRTVDEHMLFFRNAWKDDVHYVQGFAIREKPFFEAVMFKKLAMADFTSDVTMSILYKGAVVGHVVYWHEDGKGPTVNYTRDSEGLPKASLELHRETLQAPLNNMELVFTSSSLPLGPATAMVGMMVAFVAVVVVAGFVTIYRVWLGQIQLVEDRLNFVSSVSHELKTPLTSISMYAEMLRDKMILKPEKQQQYYDFIFFESERLARLIGNVLQLSKIESGENQRPSLEYCRVDSLAQLVTSKITTLAEKHHAVINVDIESNIESIEVLVDLDAICQIAINLVDNAIKFSSEDRSEHVQVEVCFHDQGHQGISMHVRDFGPGIPSDQAERIFDLFYRAGNELTRTKPGTGIGLALVSKLSNAMGGKVELRQASPGAEFVVFLNKRDSEPEASA